MTIEFTIFHVFLLNLKKQMNGDYKINIQDLSQFSNFRDDLELADF